MPANVGESPEESPEVPEPDLSMELQDQVRRCLMEHEAGCSKEEARLCRRRLPPAEEAMEIALLREKCAEIAVIEVMTTLRSFDPDISKEKLSNDIYSILHSDAVVGHLNTQLKGVLRTLVPRNRGEWLAEDIERHMAEKRAFLRLLSERLHRAVGDVVSRLPPPAQPLQQSAAIRVAVASGGSSAVLLGACGGAVGFSGGFVAGALVGLVPAAFTLGLSVPAGAVAGGGVGAATGALAGAATGALGGGVAGGAAHVYRGELLEVALLAKSQALLTVAGARTRALEATGRLKSSADEATDAVRARAAAATRLVASVANDGAIQAGVAGAASGAVVVGAGGGVAGLLTGGALGAAAGLVPAVFTLGLSVPIGAALGGGAGLCVGATSGGAVGLVGGGSAGYVAFARSEEIRSGLGGARARATGLAHLVKKRASSSASYVKTRLAGDRGGTD